MDDAPAYNPESFSDSYMVRPTTAFLKMFDKFASLSTFGGNNRTPGNMSGASNNKEKKPYNILASQLQGKIGKITRLEHKLMNLQNELADDLVDWASNIPNPDSEVMVKKFSSLVSVQRDSEAIVTDKLEKLKLNLAFVNEREKKQLDLLHSKHKILKNLRESEVKYGPNASSTTLLKEKLEENICNLGVVEIQFIRSINKNLKEALIDYLYALQAVSSNLSEVTNEYYEVLLSLESNSEGVRSSPRKVANTGIGIGLNPKKDFQYNASNYFGNLTKSASEPEYSNNSKNDTPQDYVVGNSPIRMTSRVLEDHKNYSICAECSKNNKYPNRLITPCTHNSRNSNIETSKRGIGSPTRIVQDSLGVQGFDIKDTYQSSEHWS